MDKLFPKESDFDQDFLAVSLENGIPVSTLKGFAGMESAFNPQAYREEKGIGDASYGLMQILNGTAKSVGFTGQPADLFNPRTNLKYSAKFLSGLLKKYPDLSQAVASYNMGRPRKASETTDVIKAIYGAPAPNWTYANQPYVDRVMSYIAYFQTFEDNDAAKRAVILDAIKKKIINSPLSMPRNPWFPSIAETPADSLLSSSSSSSPESVITSTVGGEKNDLA